MSKKTIPVAFLLEKANNMLEHSTLDLTQARESVAMFVADCLHQTGNYKGFGYLPTETDKSGFYGKTCRIFFYVADSLKPEYDKYHEARKNS